MRRVPLVRAPLVFAAHAYRGQALHRFLAPVKMLWLFDQNQGFHHAVPLCIDPGAGRIIFCRFDPTGSRIEVDLIGGSVGLVLRRRQGKRMQDIEVERGTVPMVLSKASEYPNVSYLFSGLSDLWSHLCRALRDAHCVSPRIVEIRGRRERERGRSVLLSEAWYREPAWDENAMYLPRAGRGQGETSSYERCGSVIVSYLGERRRPATQLSVDREIAALRLLMRLMNLEPRRDPPIAKQRRDEFFALALQTSPKLRRAEFERAWIAATLIVRALRQRDSRPKI